MYLFIWRYVRVYVCWCLCQTVQLTLRANRHSKCVRIYLSISCQFSSMFSRVQQNLADYINSTINMIIWEIDENWFLLYTWNLPKKIPRKTNWFFTNKYSIYSCFATFLGVWMNFACYNWRNGNLFSWFVHRCNEFNPIVQWSVHFSQLFLSILCNNWTNAVKWP